MGVKLRYVDHSEIGAKIGRKGLRSTENAVANGKPLRLIGGHFDEDEVQEAIIVLPHFGIEQSCIFHGVIGHIVCT